MIDSTCNDKISIGLIVNPMAGIGGRVGLKGSDGADIRSAAFSLGAVQEAPAKAVKALSRLKEAVPDLKIITCPGAMGFDEAVEAGFADESIEVLEGISKTNTEAEDTVNAAEKMLARRVRLILFAGGDGTARDVYRSVGDGIPVLGIPAGVKIHSGVYGATPGWSGEAAGLFLKGSPKIKLRDAEVMDIDEDAFRNDRVSARLYGYMKIPYERTLMQSAKAGSVQSEDAAIQSIASDVINGMKDNVFYIIGPGSTTRAVMRMLGLENTLLGVDVVYNKKLYSKDLNEKDLIELLEGKGKNKSRLIVTVIGGQGYVFGRGNQQLSSNVLRLLGISSIEIIATETKMLALEGKPLLVDTGDDDVNRSLCGYKKIITAMSRRMVYRIEC